MEAAEIGKFARHTADYMTAVLRFEKLGMMGPPLVEVLGALFPCASITGAPKVRTMQIIAALETTSRGVYTGCIGYIAPGRQAQLNVAIRTVTVDRETGQAECGGFMWPGSDQAKRAELAAVGMELQRISVGPSWPETIARGVTKVEAGLVPLDQGPLGMVLSATLHLDRPDEAPAQSALADLTAQVGYVLAWTAAVDQLNRDSQFQQFVDGARLDEAAGVVQASPLAEALHLYASGMRTKGELGVLATINAKAWADVRNRANFPAETLARLQAPPEWFNEKPQLIVLQDRVIFTGAGGNANVTLKARPLGAKRFAELHSGYLYVESGGEDNGSSFHCVIPTQ